MSNIKETGNAHRDPAAGAQEGYLYRYLLHPETIMDFIGMILLRHHMYLTDTFLAGDFSLLSAVFFISRQNFWPDPDFGEEILKG